MDTADMTRKGFVAKKVVLLLSHVCDVMVYIFVVQKLKTSKLTQWVLIMV